MAPTIRGAMFVAVLAISWLTSNTETGLAIAFATSILCIIVIVIDLLSLPSYKHVSVELTTPNVIGINENASSNYTVRSNWGRNLKFHITPKLSSEVGIDIDSSTIYEVWKRSSFPIPVNIYGLKRGSVELGQSAITISGRLGLVQKSFIYSHNDTILVIPSFGENLRYRMMAIQHKMRAVGQRVIKRRGVSSSFHNLRDYSVGDDPRYIDWKASARRRKLITKEYTVEQGQNVLIAIDAGRMMTQISGELERFEYALSSALTLAEVAVASGDNVGVLVFNDRVRHLMLPGKGVSSVIKIRDILTRSSATLVESDYAAAFNTISIHQKKRSMIVLFTDIIDPRASRSIISQTTHSIRKHLPLLIAIKNEDMHNVSQPKVTGREVSFYQSAAAEEMLTAREMALKQIRLSGVPVIDTAPKAMTSLLIDKYLEIKDRGLL